MSFDLQRLFRRVQHMIRPARLCHDAHEDKVIQRVQVRFNAVETRDLNSMQHYGFASSPKAGCDVMVINVAGDNSNGAAVASNDQRHRPRNMSAGAVRVYNDAGSYVHIQGGTITIVAPTKLVITTPEVEMSGKLTVANDIVSTSGDVKAGAITLKTHKHLGVTVGAGTSGLPTA